MYLKHCTNYGVTRIAIRKIQYVRTYTGINFSKGFKLSYCNMNFLIRSLQLLQKTCETTPSTNKIKPCLSKHEKN